MTVPPVPPAGPRSFVIRPARIADGEQVGAVLCAASLVAYRSILPQHLLQRYQPELQIPVWTERIRAQDDAHAVVVAVDDAAGPVAPGVVGFAWVGLETTDPTVVPTGELYHLFVDPAQARRGIGAALMSTAQRWIAQRGPRQAVLWVYTDNRPARRFYEAVGWQFSGVERRDPSLLELGVDVDERRYDVHLTHAGCVEES